MSDIARDDTSGEEWGDSWGEGSEDEDTSELLKTLRLHLLSYAR